MKEYIATFFSHFYAVRFHRKLTAEGLEARCRPVPRDLSSSCGTCVWFRTDDAQVLQGIIHELRQDRGEIEKLAEVSGSGYRFLQ